MLAGRDQLACKLTRPSQIAGTGFGVSFAPCKRFATGRQRLGGPCWAGVVHGRSQGHRQAVQSLPQTIDGQLSVYAVSDLHCDYPANVAWVQGLPSYKQGQQKQHHDLGHSTTQQQQLLHQSVCVVAGDISDDLRIVRCAGSGRCVAGNAPLELQPLQLLLHTQSCTLRPASLQAGRTCAACAADY
jgi:hypothetical protein